MKSLAELYAMRDAAIHEFMTREIPKIEIDALWELTEEQGYGWKTQAAILERVEVIRNRKPKLPPLPGATSCKLPPLPTATLALPPLPPKPTSPAPALPPLPAIRAALPPLPSQ